MNFTRALAVAAIAITLTCGALAGKATAAGAVESALKLAAIDKQMDAELKKAPQRAKRIVQLALLKKGQKVGKGECTDLVQLALAASESRPGITRNYRNYNWGSKRPEGTPISIGDIIQFEQCTFETTTKSGNSTSTSKHEMEHHTAIVRYAKGKMVVLLHQNDQGSPVKQTVLNLADIKSGHYTVWIASPGVKLTK